MEQEQITEQITQLESAINQRSNFLINNDPQVQRLAGQLEVYRALVEKSEPEHVE
jgi:phage-related minor tail protein|tara:strand:- start:1559 stop:1723 length:165 start_codon:yes stop_codon:yes gene_type:complete